MARDFGGTNDFITASGPAFGTVGSIALWVRKDFADNDANARYVYDASSANRYLMYHPGNISNQYGFYLNGVLVVLVTDLLQGTGWHHVAITWDNSLGSAKEKIYKNGSQFTTANISITGATPTNFYIGQHNGAQERWDGGIAEFATYSVVLSPDEILALAKGLAPSWVRSQSLLSYWPLWGVASPEADLSGKGKNGTVTGAVLANHAPVGRYAPDLQVADSYTTAAAATSALTMLV